MDAKKKGKNANSRPAGSKSAQKKNKKKVITRIIRVCCNGGINMEQIPRVTTITKPVPPPEITASVETPKSKPKSKKQRKRSRNQSKVAKPISPKSPKETLNGIKNAAFQTRLPFKFLTPEERHSFQDINIDDDAATNIFINIRNRLLQMWLQNPKQQLTFDEGLKNMQSPFSSDPLLVKRIHAFLERHGCINFGVFKSLHPIIPITSLKVIVIGAGISGLGAARHLAQFGVDVVVLEARNRVGGRIATFGKGSYHTDIGAMIVPGSGGNPITILSKQIGIPMIPVQGQCLIYGQNGKLLNSDSNRMLEDIFTHLLHSKKYVWQEIESFNNPDKHLSLDELVDFIAKQRQKRLRKKKLLYLTEMMRVRAAVADNKKHFEEVTETVNRLESIHSYLIAQCRHNKPNPVEVQTRVVQIEWDRARKELEELREKGKVLSQELKAFDETSPKDEIVFQNAKVLKDAKDKSRKDCLHKHCSDYEDFRFNGSYTTFHNGYSRIPVALSQGLDIRLSTAVKTIKYSDKGVEIVAENLANNNSTTTYKADVVLCTIPLGVLKRMIEKTESSQTDENLFDPPLPDWKKEAIANLGVSTANKVVLCFDRIFWDQRANLFGNINKEKSSQGEFFLFWSIPRSSTLVALFSGKCAMIVENLTDEAITERCIDVLRNIFGKGSVPTPKASTVTRWLRDPWACGSHSFISSGTSSTQYDALACPLCTPITGSNNKQKPVPHLFFAGEHTIRNYRSTVHGAFLSGLREAGRIMDYYFHNYDGNAVQTMYSSPGKK